MRPHERFDRDRLERASRRVTPRGPAGTVMASIDACRALVKRTGRELLERLLGNIGPLRVRLREELPGLEVPDEHAFEAGRFDPTRLVLLLSGSEPTASKSTGGSSPRAFPSSSPTVTRSCRSSRSPTTRRPSERSSTRSCPAIRATSGPPRPPSTALSWRVGPVNVMTPRAAFSRLTRRSRLTLP